MRRKTASTLLLTLTLAVAAAQKPGEPSPEPPPPAPLSLRIVGTGKVAIDRRGRTAAAYRAGVKNGTISPSPLSCDLAVKVTNHTKETLKVRLTGAAPGLVLSLTGKGEVVTRTGTRTRGRVSYAELPPGGSTTIPLGTLSGFRSATATHLHPLDAGDYELTATFSTYIYGGRAVPAKAKGKGLGFGRMGPAFGGKNPNVLKTTTKFRLKVTAK